MIKKVLNHGDTILCESRRWSIFADFVLYIALGKTRKDLRDKLV